MPHMIYSGGGSSCDDGGCGGTEVRIISYTATGAESPAGFDVPIGVTLAADTYHVAFWGVEADVIVPWAWSFPTAGKEVTQFEVRFTGDGLTVGAVYKFQLIEED